jgi:hypothetical protein
MTAREVDRDGNGERDAFYVFEDGALAQERHDTNGDTKIDRTVYYAAKRLDHAEEDQNHDGKVDTWTKYQNDLIVRIERDADGDGVRDTFETYDISSGRSLIALREEDKNQDGTIDVKSVYEQGKLKQRQISNAGLTPL